MEICTHPEAHPLPHWVDSVRTYKAKCYLRAYAAELRCRQTNRCPHCAPLPGQEVIGFVDDAGHTTLHRRDCPLAISLSAQRGDSIVDVDFLPQATDRFHLVSDIVDCITKGLHLSMHYLHTEVADNIVECTVHYAVHSVEELRTAVRSLGCIEGVDEVYKL